MTTPVTPDDYHAIDDLLARYCWTFDDGDAEGHAKLWTEDGVLTGFGDPQKGIEAIKGVLAGSYDTSRGKWRHVLNDVTIVYGADRDTAVARGYNMVTKWDDEQPGLLFNVRETWDLKRTADGWRFTAVNLNMT